MTYGEMQIEVLRLLFANDDQDLTPEKIEDYKDDQKYSVFMVNMWSAFNRCFADLENKAVLPKKRIELDPKEGTQNRYGNFIRFPREALPLDLLSIEAVAYETAGQYCDNVEYQLEGQDLLLPVFDPTEETYTLVYNPKIPRLKPYTPVDTVIDIPNNIAEYVPYFVASEMNMEESPYIASEYKANYQYGVSSLSSDAYHPNTEVSTVWRCD